MPNPRLRRSRVAVAAALVALALAVAAATDGESPLPCAARPELSLLALGDTGRIQHPVGPLGAQWRVGRALEREDERCPVDGVVFLGDNFYTRGLQSFELVKRIRQNVVGAYCRFVALDGPRSQEVETACLLPEARRHVVPLWAVLGNHDYASPESPRLQREAVPRFVPNWHLLAGAVELRELGDGVSLLLYDPHAADPHLHGARIAEALRASRGPWRILASHYPLTRLEGGEVPPVAAPVVHAVRETGVDLHLLLGGHEHALYAADPRDPGLGFQVVAGSGAQVDPEAHVPFEDLRFARAVNGFVRVDLERRAGAERLVVSLVAVPLGALRSGPAEVVARFAVDRAGRATALAAGDEGEQRPAADDEDAAADGRAPAGPAAVRYPAPPTPGEVPESG